LALLAMEEWSGVEVVRAADADAEDVMLCHYARRRLCGVDVRFDVARRTDGRTAAWVALYMYCSWLAMRAHVVLDE
jgi:hypothetical protein